MVTKKYNQETQTRDVWRRLYTWKLKKHTIK